MRRVSQRRREKIAGLTEQYADSCGIPFEMSQLHGLYLPNKVSDWPKMQRVTDAEVCKLFHWLWFACWFCEAGECQAHHMAAGSRGRSDELCLLVSACAKCHDQIHGGIIPIGRVLFVKWQMDRVHTNWVRTTLAFRRWLPDLITEAR